MKTWQELVREFPNGSRAPESLYLRDAELRARLILEEALEAAYALVGSELGWKLAIEAVGKNDHKEPRPSEASIPGAVHELCDLVYVSLGTAEVIGVDLDPYFRIVHMANIAKRCSARDEHGKILKGSSPGPAAAIDELLKLHEALFISERAR